MSPSGAQGISLSASRVCCCNPVDHLSAEICCEFIGALSCCNRIYRQNGNFIFKTVELAAQPQLRANNLDKLVQLASACVICWSGLRFKTKMCNALALVTCINARIYLPVLITWTWRSYSRDDWAYIARLAKSLAMVCSKMHCIQFSKLADRDLNRFHCDNVTVRLRWMRLNSLKANAILLVVSGYLDTSTYFNDLLWKYVWFYGARSDAFMILNQMTPELSRICRPDS